MLTGRKLELVVNVRSGRKVSLLRPALFKGKQYKVDVRNFITDKDATIQKIVDDNELSVHTGRKVHFDDTMKKCWEYLKDNYDYTYDTIDDERSDYWQLPAVIAQYGKDDCDGLALLLMALCLNAGIPYYRLQIALGKVSKDRVAPSGGHAWIMYLNEEGKWEVWESTSKKTGYKGIASEIIGNGWYHSIYNTINLKSSFKHDKITNYE